MAGIHFDHAKSWGSMGRERWGNACNNPIVFSIFSWAMARVNSRLVENLLTCHRLGNTGSCNMVWESYNIMEAIVFELFQQIVRHRVWLLKMVGDWVYSAWCRRPLCSLWFAGFWLHRLYLLKLAQWSFETIVMLLRSRLWICLDKLQMSKNISNNWHVLHLFTTYCTCKCVSAVVERKHLVSQVKWGLLPSISCITDIKSHYFIKVKIVQTYPAIIIRSFSKLWWSSAPCFCILLGSTKPHFHNSHSM